MAYTGHLPMLGRLMGWTYRSLRPHKKHIRNFGRGISW